MFHFPAFPPRTLCVQVRVTPHNWCRVSPFGHPGITARLTAPPGLSRPPTSFIGSWCQGIHRLLSATSQQRCSRPLCNSQTTTNPPTEPPPHTHRPRSNTHHRGLSSLMTGRGRNQENSATRLFPQDPTGCLNATHQPHHRPDPHPTKQPHKGQPRKAVRGPLAVADRSFTSVSANEHPTKHTRLVAAPGPHYRARRSLERR